MFSSRSILAGVEIGTAKVCAVIGEVSESGALSIIGLGQAKSRGVRKGEIVDPGKASDDIRNAVVEAEHMADAEVNRVYLGVTGGHLRGFNNRGVHPVVSADRHITEQDVEDVVKNAKAINVAADHHVVHVIRQHFAVDGQEGVSDPVGMAGARIEADVLVVHGNTNRMQNAIRVVRSLQIDVEDVVFNGLASAVAVLTSEQKELGSLVIDIGGGATEYAVYAGGIIKHAGVFAVGGDHITNDLAYGLKTSISRAERLKIEHGVAIAQDAKKGERIRISSSTEPIDRSVSAEKLQRIQAARVEEILELVHADLYERRLLGFVRAGVSICGGGARIPGIHELARQVFKAPSTTGRTQGINGLSQALDQPEFVTGIGLIKCGAFQKRRRESGGRGLRGAITTLFRRG